MRHLEAASRRAFRPQNIETRRRRTRRQLAEIGESIGIDRLIKMITGAESIRDVILSPQFVVR